MTTHGDHVTMRDGSVIVVRNGEETPMQEEITMSDGTRVLPNGQLLLTDGTARMLRDGETLDLVELPRDAENLSDAQFKEAMEDEELRDQLH